MMLQFDQRPSDYRGAFRRSGPERKRVSPPPPRRPGDRPQRRDGERPPRRDGGQPPRRDGGQPPRRDGGQPPRRDGGQPPRRDGRQPPRREGDRPRSPRPTDDERPRGPRLREPELAADISPKDLDRDARAELRSLPVSLADKVASHLVAAGRALDDDPQLAHTHAWYARQLAPRLAIVREAAGVTAYAVGDYAAALAELRAARRITGDPSSLPMMADCERGLGRPDRALALARDPDVKKLDPVAKIELGIVVSGARRDRGEYDAAVVALQGPALDSDQLQPC